MTPVSALPLARTLVRCASVTPDAGQALDAAESVLSDNGFACHRLVFSEAGTPDVDNLFATKGSGPPHLCLAGHVDVVPPGDEALWSSPPFAAEIRDGTLFGRGAEDMKGAVAAEIAAACEFARETPDFKGTLSLLLTGDEEGPAINGTRKVLEWLKDKVLVPDHCLLGEPTSQSRVGDTIKVGRRGSLNGRLMVSGRQGHTAYPHLADNPIPKMMQLLSALLEPFDEGSTNFEPTNLQVTSVDVGNRAVNVVPASATAAFNIRFNDHWTAAGLTAELDRRLSRAAVKGDIRFTLETDCNAEAFFTEPGIFVDLVRSAVTNSAGVVPEASTGGGTSDARFIAGFCPVVELGPVGRSMHQVDEHLPIAELEQLVSVYRAVIDSYFSR